MIFVCLRSKAVQQLVAAALSVASAVLHSQTYQPGQCIAYFSYDILNMPHYTLCPSVCPLSPPFCFRVSDLNGIHGTGYMKIPDLKMHEM